MGMTNGRRGSSPVSRVLSWHQVLKTALTYGILLGTIQRYLEFRLGWGRSSAGRAAALHAAGRRFESDRLHFFQFSVASRCKPHAVRSTRSRARPHAVPRRFFALVPLGLENDILYWSHSGCCSLAASVILEERRACRAATKEVLRAFSADSSPSFRGSTSSPLRSGLENDSLGWGLTVTRVPGGSWLRRSAF